MKLLRRLYDWVLHWAHTPYGSPALFFMAVAESSFFPVPPDVLLMALSLSKPKKAFFYAMLSSIGSVIGGVIGFYIGLEFWELGKGIIMSYADQETFNTVRGYFIEYEAWTILAVGFTPIPYKVFTISAGFFRVDFTIFIVASIISRSARFFLVGGLIYLYGQPVKSFIDKYFNILTIVFMALLIGGFLLLKYVL